MGTRDDLTDRELHDEWYRNLYGITEEELRQRTVLIILDKTEEAEILGVDPDEHIDEALQDYKDELVELRAKNEQADSETRAIFVRLKQRGEKARQYIEDHGEELKIQAKEQGVDCVFVGFPEADGQPVIVFGKDFPSIVQGFGSKYSLAKIKLCFTWEVIINMSNKEAKEMADRMWKRFRPTLEFLRNSEEYRMGMIKQKKKYVVVGFADSKLREKIIEYGNSLLELYTSMTMRYSQDEVKKYFNWGRIDEYGSFHLIVSTTLVGLCRAEAEMTKGGYTS